jgi:hypothetical protein
MVPVNLLHHSFRDPVHHRCAGRARPPQCPHHFHVGRVDAERGQPGDGGVRQRAQKQFSGQIFVFFVIAVAAAEVAVGLALIVEIFKSKRSIDVDQMSSMKG